MKIIIPPEYDRNGRKQWCFVESENGQYDDLINGALHAMIPFALSFGIFGALSILGVV